MITEKSWKEFREAGLLWWVNTILHTFGWAIVFEFKTYDKETDTGEIERVYPARVKFRGFDDKSVTQGYIAISEYMKNNVDELLKESKE